MEQLKLTNKELKLIGFKECKSKGDEMNLPYTYFKIETVNGYFYCNPSQEVYKWYHKTTIGGLGNNVHLDISKREGLFVLLQCFKVEFNLVF